MFSLLPSTRGPDVIVQAPKSETKKPPFVDSETLRFDDKDSTLTYLVVLFLIVGMFGVRFGRTKLPWQSQSAVSGTTNDRTPASTKAVKTGNKSNDTSTKGATKEGSHQNNVAPAGKATPNPPPKTNAQQQTQTASTAASNGPNATKKASKKINQQPKGIDLTSSAPKAALGATANKATKSAAQTAVKQPSVNAPTRKPTRVQIVTDTESTVKSLEHYHRSYGRVVWIWEEDSAHLRNHDEAVIRKGTNYVFYGAGVSDEIEGAYQEWRRGYGNETHILDLKNKAKKFRQAKTGLSYAINFQTMTQTNLRSNFVRCVCREVRSIDVGFPSIPTDFFVGQKDAPFLPTHKGQIIEVLAEHPSKQWLRGKVVYDPDGKTDLVGWFPASFSNPFGAGMSDGLVMVDTGTEEYNIVADYFKSKFVKLVGKDLPVVHVVTVERIQSKRLWKGYKQHLDAMKEHYTENPWLLENNQDIEGLERKQLFHGTTAETMPKIINQGFNRSFAGSRSGTMYGKGSYFSYYSSYSDSYAPADLDGIRRMFLCRVAVGDWCKGTKGKLTPDPKQLDENELFDSTVNFLERPSIFVTYHDAQAFPEYLVSYKQAEI